MTDLPREPVLRRMGNASLGPVLAPVLGPVRVARSAFHALLKIGKTRRRAVDSQFASLVTGFDEHEPQRNVFPLQLLGLVGKVEATLQVGLADRE